jgi:dTDP-4-amino-4,6-dideoxy-D-galactose acyltransferase
MVKLINRLAWDSRFFGKQVGKINVQKNEPLEDLLCFAKKQGYELLYIYCDSAVQEAIVGSYNLFDVGGHIRFVKSSDRFIAHETTSQLEISPYTQQDLTPELIKIAFLSGHSSRFKMDISLPAGSFERLYETWIKNSLERRPQVSIYIYSVKSTPVGLITAEWSEFNCIIGLLAVLPAFQGQGIGTKLIKYVESICMLKGIISIEVKTQLSNRGARDLYVKNSFLEQDRSFLYHGHSI